MLIIDICPSVCFICPYTSKLKSQHVNNDPSYTPLSASTVHRVLLLKESTCPKQPRTSQEYNLFHILLCYYLCVDLYAINLSPMYLFHKRSP